MAVGRHDAVDGAEHGGRVGEPVEMLEDRRACAVSEQLKPAQPIARAARGVCESFGRDVAVDVAGVGAEMPVRGLDIATVAFPQPASRVDR